MKQTNWEKIYTTDFIYAPGCWKTCDGYCCKNFYSSYSSVLDKNAVVLPLLEKEFAYYQEIGGIKNITKPAKKRTFKMKNGKEFSIYLLSCSCGGLCNPHTARPLICRIYPYFPIVKADGSILDFEYAALMDLFYRKPEQTHKCTLVREQSEKVKNELRSTMKELLEDPEVVFIFMCLRLLVERLKSKMGGYIDEMDEEKKKRFINKYEWMVLSGKPWTDEAFSQQITDIYEEVKIANQGMDFL